MDDLLMKKNEQVRFAILKKLVFTKVGISVDELMNSFDVSSPTIYRHINSLRKDLTQVFPDNDVDLIQNGNSITICYHSTNLIYLIDSMRLYYITSTQRFAVIEATLSKVYPSIESLAQELHLSTSYTYKTVAMFNKLLDKFHLKIKFNLFQSRSSVEGNEVDLRLFLFFSQWVLFKGINMPLQESLPNFYTPQFPIKHQLGTTNQATQLTHYQVITYYRIVAKKNRIQLSEDFFAYLMLFESVSPTHFPLEIVHSIDRNFFTVSDLKHEEAFFGFVARFFVAGIDSISTKRAIVQKLLASGLPLTTFVETFLADFRVTFKLAFSDEEYFSAYYLLSMQLLYHQFIAIDLTILDPSKEIKTMLNPIKLAKLTQFVEQKLSPLLIQTEAKAGLIAQFSEALYTILKKNQKKKLSLFVHYSRSIYLNDFIKNNLAMTFSSETIEFTDSIAEADLFISDTFEEVSEQQQVFYLENPYDVTTWHELILFISDCLFLLT